MSPSVLLIVIIGILLFFYLINKNIISKKDNFNRTYQSDEFENFINSLKNQTNNDIKNSTENKN